MVAETGRNPREARPDQTVTGSGTSSSAGPTSAGVLVGLQTYDLAGNLGHGARGSKPSPTNAQSIPWAIYAATEGPAISAAAAEILLQDARIDDPRSDGSTL
jgi:hypothetical protein